jgi:hypothetical protein
MAEHDSHQIDGKWIDVKRCVIQDPAQRKQQGYPTQAAGPIRRRENFPVPQGATGTSPGGDYYYNAPPSAYYAGYAAAAAYRPGATGASMYGGAVGQMGQARPVDPYYAARMGGAAGPTATATTAGYRPSQAGPGGPGQAGYMPSTGYNYYPQVGSNPYYATASAAGYATAAPTGGYAAYGQPRSDYYGASGTMGYYGVGVGATGAAGTQERKPNTSPGGSAAASGYRSGPY